MNAHWIRRRRLSHITSSWPAALLVMLGLVFFATPASADLVGYWSFDDETADDLSGFGNDGFVNGVEFSDDVPIGSGMSIYVPGNGGNVQVSDSDSLGMADTLSIAYWIKADNLDQGTANWNGPMSKYAGSPQIGWEFQRYDNQSRLDMRVDTDAGENSVFGNLTGTFDGEWVHVAWTVDAGEWTSFIDGEFAGSGTYPHGDGFANEGNLVIGCRGGWCAYVGYLDEIGIWDTVLTDDEIADLAAGGSPIGSTMPVAGAGTIGARTFDGERSNEQFGPAGGVTPGLLQEWVNAANPGNRDAIVDLIDNGDTVVPPFKSSDGTSWWTGNQTPGWNVPQYPSEVVAGLSNPTQADNYVVRMTGEMFFPKSGTYRFTDGVDDYTYWAVDADKSGEAGDDLDEVLIDDNAWTNLDARKTPAARALVKSTSALPREASGWRSSS